MRVPDPCLAMLNKVATVVTSCTPEHFTSQCVIVKAIQVDHAMQHTEQTASVQCDCGIAMHKTKPAQCVVPTEAIAKSSL